MIPSAVYIWSYGENERGDYQSSSATESLRDAELEIWLRDEIHDALTSQSWKENQTVFVCTNKDTTTSHYIVLARIVGRYTQNRYPYRELVALYIDSGKIKENDLLGIVSGIPWDDLIVNRPNAVELHAAKPGDNPLSSLAGQISRKAGGRPIFVERFWETLSDSTVLYWCLSGLPYGQILFSTVVTGVSKDWPPILDAQVVVQAANDLTPFDPDSNQYNLAVAAERGELLKEYTPVSYGYLSANIASLNQWVHLVKRRHEIPTGAEAAFPIAPLLIALQDNATELSKVFEIELSGRAESHSLSNSVAEQVRAAWLGLFEPYRSKVGELVQKAQRLPTTKQVTIADIESAARRIYDDKAAESEFEIRRRLDQIEVREGTRKHELDDLIRDVNQLHAALVALKRSAAEGQMQTRTVEPSPTGSPQSRKWWLRLLSFASKQQSEPRPSLPFRRKIWLGVAALLVIGGVLGWRGFLTFASGQEETPGGRGTKKHAPSKFGALFDGKSLGGWLVPEGGDGEEANGTGWDIKDGALRSGPNAVDLETVGVYEYFDLKLEYRLRSQEADSGVLIRVDPVQGSAATGLEVALSRGGMYQEGELLGLSHAEDAMKRSPKPIGEWNQLRIVVSEDKCYTELNGERCSTFTLAQVSSRSEESEVPVMPFAHGPGSIVLKGGKGNVMFRNIRIAELKD